jgi:hypothetical protein
MPVLAGLTVVVTTSTRNNADAPGRFSLQIVNSEEDRILPFAPGDLQRGRTNQYFFDLTSPEMGDMVVDTDETAFRLIMMATGSDFWLPSSIFALGHNRDQGGGVLVGFHPTWPEDGGWFSTAASETSTPTGATRHVISGSP